MVRRMVLFIVLVSVCITGVADADVIVRSGGAIIRGKVVKEDDTYIYVKTKFGEQPIPKTSVVEIKKEEDIKKEFEDRFEKACKCDGCHELESLLSWCESYKLKEYGDQCAEEIISRRPLHEKARKWLGHKRIDGKWIDVKKAAQQSREEEEETEEEETEEEEEEESEEPQEENAETVEAKARELLKEGRHKRALGEVERFLRVGEMSEEEREKLEQLKRDLACERDMAEAKRLFKQTKSAGKAYQYMEKVFTVHTNLSPEVDKRFKDLFKQMRSRFCWSIDDFEWPELRKKWTTHDTFIKYVTDKNYIQQGFTAAQFHVRKDTIAAVITVNVPPNWKRYRFLSMYMRWDGEERGIREVTYEVCSGGNNYWLRTNSIDWRGWKRTRVKIWQSGNKFFTHGDPDWEKIQYLRIYIEEGPAGTITIDDLKLEK